MQQEVQREEGPSQCQKLRCTIKVEEFALHPGLHGGHELRIGRDEVDSDEAEHQADGCQPALHNLRRER